MRFSFFGMVASRRPQEFTNTHIESAARYLVQKIARENAAEHNVAVIEAEMSRAVGEPDEVWRNVRRMPLLAFARRRHRIARQIRDAAVVDLRNALGLQDHPSQIEINGWGEAP